jgi:hypothetical protein
VVEARVGGKIPPSRSMYPSYSYPDRFRWGLAASILFGTHRSFRCDGQSCLGRLRPPLRVLGEENIPAAGPCIITFNHYYRPGFNAWWMSLALAATVPVEIHFVMTGELTFPGKWYAPLGMSGSRWLLRRISQTYGFTTMPPMPPRPKDIEKRAYSVRAVLSYARAHPRAILGLAPEGGDQPGGILNWPAPGAGRFISLLACPDQNKDAAHHRLIHGFSIIPAGVYEETGSLHLNFGKAYDLALPPGLPANEKDHRVAEIVMSAIARQLPERLRGVFDLVGPE